MNRKIDNLGRIVLPMEIRKSLNINPNDELVIETTGNKIVMRKSNSKEFENFLLQLRESKSIDEKLLIDYILKKYNELS